ncbi:MAG: hypothetical protein IT310_14195, partial [Anaerolineales bacterium]|nr:hypothetical protein [Anaerolineales bacterium]
MCLVVIVLYLLPVNTKPEFIAYRGQIIEVPQTQSPLRSIYPEGAYATCGEGGTGTNCHVGCCSNGACVTCQPQSEDRPPIIYASLNCSNPGTNDWCTGSLTI